MQKIETLDALRGVSNGATVTVADNDSTGVQQVFEKMTDGLRREGFTLSFEDFAGEVEAGRVWQGVRIANRQLWQRGSYYYYVYRAYAHGPNADQHIILRLFDTGEFYEVVTYADERAERYMGTLASTNPGWLTEPFRSMLEALGGHWLSQQTTADRRQRDAESYTARINDLEARVVTLQREQEEKKAAIESGLIQFASDHDLIDSPLGDLMAGWDMRRPFRSETVAVTAYVEGSHYMPIADASSVLSFETTSARADSVQIRWTREMTFDRITPEGECACSQVDYDMVREAMQAEGTWENIYSMDHRRVCTSSGHPERDGEPRRI